MPKWRTVSVHAGKGYDVMIGGGLIADCGRLIAAELGRCRAAVITDSNVESLYLNSVMISLEQAGLDAVCHIFPAGEENKNLATLWDILELLAENHIGRGDIVIALGGGVTGDTAGFAAGVYLRGIRYVQMPTTLLAAVDSSVGGKTAVDLEAGKNLAGVFKQPELVLCDTHTLETLTDYDMANGMAEAIKTAVLFSHPLFDMFGGEMTPAVLADIIESCVRFKAHIVEIDERERNERRLLNLGHTIGHAIEKCSGYTVGHGHAVAAGMAMMCRAGEKMGITELGTAYAVEETLERFGLPTNTDYTTDQLADAALNDKKRSGDTITIVVPETIGQCTLRTEPIEALSKYIELGRVRR